MSQKITLYPAPVGKAVTLSTPRRSQSTPAWGGGNTGGGGSSPGTSMTIATRRSGQQVAPEGIAFFANVSGFDAPQNTTAGLVPGEVYDEAMHDIAYVWDFDDAGEFSALDRMLPAWKDRNVGYGPLPSHVFSTPGTYTVLCGAYERSSGKQAFASINVTVGDPDAYFADAYTICIAPDNDFTGAPTTVSANRVTTIAAAYSRYNAIKGAGQPVRVLLKSGQTHPMTALWESRFGQNGYIGTWGGTSRAIITVDPAYSAGFVIHDSNTIPGCTIANIDFRAAWVSSDPKGANPSQTMKMSSFVEVRSGFGTIYNCRATGVSGGYTAGKIQSLTAIFGNCEVENWKGIGFYVQTETAAPDAALANYVSLVGCKATQDVNATQNGVIQTDIEGQRDNDLGSIRIQLTGYMYIDAFEAFNRNGQTNRTDGSPADQGCIRDHRNDPRSKGFFSRIFAEGGFQTISSGDASGGLTYPCNTVYDKFMVLGSANSAAGVEASNACTTIRNGIIQRPNVPSGSNGYNRSILVPSGSTTADKSTSENKAYPVKIYNVTCVNELDNANDPGSWVIVEIKPGFWNEGQVQIANNVQHRPNFPGGFVGDAPLDATRLGIAPRYLGYKWYGYTKGGTTVPAKIPMDTSYATPADPWSLWRPQTAAQSGTTDSPAIGSATGDLVAYDDLLGNVRPASASRGAIEPV